MDYIEKVEALHVHGLTDEAYKVGLTGYVTISILVEAYRNAGMLSEALYIRLRKVLYMYKDFVESIKIKADETTAINILNAVTALATPTIIGA